MSKISAAHVSAVLGRWYTRASDERDRVSGFVVSTGPTASIPAVTVSYQDYSYGSSDAEQERAGKVIEAAFDEYAATLARAGYVTEKWMKYDGSQLGLFVTGKK
jgi:hypothetical protein